MMAAPPLFPGELGPGDFGGGMDDLSVGLSPVPAAAPLAPSGPATWPPTLAAQTAAQTEKGTVLLTPALSKKTSKGFAYVPYGEFAAVVGSRPPPLHSRRHTRRNTRGDTHLCTRRHVVNGRRE